MHRTASSVFNPFLLRGRFAIVVIVVELLHQGCCFVTEPVALRSILFQRRSSPYGRCPLDMQRLPWESFIVMGNLVVGLLHLSEWLGRYDYGVAVIERGQAKAYSRHCTCLICKHPHTFGSPASRFCCDCIFGSATSQFMVLNHSP